MKLLLEKKVYILYEEHMKTLEKRAKKEKDNINFDSLQIHNSFSGNQFSSCR